MYAQIVLSVPLITSATENSRSCSVALDPETFMLLPEFHRVQFVGTSSPTARHNKGVFARFAPLRWDVTFDNVAPLGVTVLPRRIQASRDKREIA